MITNAGASPAVDVNRLNDPAYLWELLSSRIKGKSDVQQKLNAHVAAHSGNKYPDLESFYSNGAPVEDKVAVLRKCLTAVAKNDFSSLAGSVANGQAVQSRADLADLTAKKLQLKTATPPVIDVQEATPPPMPEPVPIPPSPAPVPTAKEDELAIVRRILGGAGPVDLTQLEAKLQQMVKTEVERQLPGVVARLRITYESAS